MKSKKTYNKISQEERKKFVRHYSKHGNATEAVKYAQPEAEHYTESSLSVRGSRMLKDVQIQQALHYIDNSIKQGAVKAIDKVIDMVDSTDEKIATKNAHYLIDHAVGKAVNRTESKQVTINIESVLD